MIVKFKNNKANADIEAGMGLFDMVLINDEPDRKLTMMLHAFNKKWANTSDSAAVNKELTHDLQFDIRDTTGSKVIAGYTCKRAIAHSKDKKTPDFELYYTSDVQLDEPNWPTPFRQVKGVLMEYRLTEYGFYMQFTAQKVQPDKIDDDMFKIPADYKMMPKKDLDDLIKGVQ